MSKLIVGCVLALTSLVHAESLEGEVRAQCRDGEKRKATVAKKVKGMQCTWGPKRSVTVKNGIVLLTGNGNDFNGLAGYVRDTLMKKI